MEDIEYIHQIMIVDGFSLPETLTGFFLENKKRMIKFHRRATYKLWGGAQLESFIGEHFPPDVLEAFNSLQAYAYKADLARLCVLYVYGGLYIDLGVRLMEAFYVPKGMELCAYRDLFQEDSWFMVQNGLIYAKKGRPELMYAINYIVENVKNRYYGKNSLFPTGPVQLGRAIAYVAAMAGPGGDETQWIGECRPITPSEANKNMVYTSPSGRLSAVRAKIKAGDLAHMGLRGGNNHNIIWQSRRVYGENLSIWEHSDKQMRIKNARHLVSGVVPARFGKGLVTWGPYVSLPAGKFIFRMRFSDRVFFDSVILEVSCHPNCRCLVKKKFSYFAFHNASLEVSFSLDEPAESVELKFYKGLFFEGRILSFEIEEVVTV